MHCSVYPLMMHGVFVYHYGAQAYSSCVRLCSMHACVCVNHYVCVLRGRKEAMSHSTHTTRTQQLPLLPGQGKPRRCGCIVWKNRADRDIIGRLSPTPGRDGGRTMGQQVEAVSLSLRQFLFVSFFLFPSFPFLSFFNFKDRLPQSKAETATHS